MIVHKVIDALLEGPGKLRLFIPEGAEDPPDGYTDELAGWIDRAEKFEFMSVPLESTEIDGVSVFAVPRPTEGETEAFSERLIALPAPFSWYEFADPADSYVAGALVREVSDGWAIKRLDSQGTKVFLDTVTFVVPHKWHQPGVFGWHVRYPATEGGDKIERSARFRRYVERNASNSVVYLAIYLTLMLGSRTTVVSQAPISEQLARARAKRGVTPLPAHRIVRIVPDEIIRASRAEAGLGARLPPRLHWRRSHIRHLGDDRKVLIPRCLVGKPENGTVSHEYRIG